MPQWAFGSLAVAAILAFGVLMLDDVRLRSRVDQAESSHAALERRESELRAELERARRVPVLTTVALVLPPPRRDAARIPALALPQGATSVGIDLELEVDDFPAYRVVMKRSSSGGALWTSAELNAHPGGARKAVSMQAPASLLQPGNYILELSPAGPNSQVIATYQFQVTPQ
jgi:hypothetical protein